MIVGIFGERDILRYFIWFEHKGVIVLLKLFLGVEVALPFSMGSVDVAVIEGRDTIVIELAMPDEIDDYFAGATP